MSMLVDSLYPTDGMATSHAGVSSSMSHPQWHELKTVVHSTWPILPCDHKIVSICDRHSVLIFPHYHSFSRMVHQLDSGTSECENAPSLCYAHARSDGEDDGCEKRRNDS